MWPNLGITAKHMRLWLCVTCVLKAGLWPGVRGYELCGVERCFAFKKANMRFGKHALWAARALTESSFNGRRMHSGRSF